MKTLTFQLTYFRWALGLLSLELSIGLYMHDALVRPYGGDLLVVILLYCLVKSFVQASVTTLVLVLFVLACVVEVSQYAGLIYWLGWQQSQVAHLVLGSHFAWGDILAYALGTGCVLGAEWVKSVGNSVRWRAIR